MTVKVKTLAEWRSKYADQAAKAKAKYDARVSDMKIQYKAAHAELCGVLGVTPGNAMTSNYDEFTTAAKYHYGDADNYIKGVKKAMARNR